MVIFTIVMIRDNAILPVILKHQQQAATEKGLHLFFSKQFCSLFLLTYVVPFELMIGKILILFCFLLWCKKNGELVIISLLPLLHHPRRPIPENKKYKILQYHTYCAFQLTFYTGFM